MKRIESAVVVFIFWTFFCPAQAANGSPADKLSEIMKRGKMVIACLPEYPPMSKLIKGAARSSDTKCFSNEYVGGELTGFETDAAIEVARRLGVEPCFCAPAWVEIVAGKWAGRWDIAFTSLSITYERMEYLYFTTPYYSEPAAFFVHKDNAVFKSAADLSGKRIGVCAGCIYENYLEGTLSLPGWKKTEPIIWNPDIAAYDKQFNSIRELSIGDGVKMDAAFISIFLGHRSISDGMPIRQLGDPLIHTYISAGVDKKQTGNPIPFIRKINEIIGRMHDDGTLSKLSEKYFHLKTDVITPAKNFDIKSLGQY